MMAAAMARPTPVLPDVGSTIVPPGRSLPSRSAASIMRRPIRSLTEPPGFRYSSFASTVASIPRTRRWRRTSGVLPTRSRIVGLASAQVDELLVRTAFDDPATVEDEDQVGVANGREAVGDGHGGAALREAVEGVLDRPLGLDVERARRLVQHQHRRVAEDCAGDGDALLLATREAV